MKALRTFGKNHPALIAFLGLALAMCALYLIVPLFPLNGLGDWAGAVAEIGYTLIILVFALLFFGPQVIKFSMEGFGWSVRKCLYFIIVYFVLGALLWMNVLSKGALSSSNAPVIIAACTVDCIFVGLFEELTFRTVLFGGLVKKWGNTHAGILWAAVVSSFLFGLVHNISPILNGVALGPVEIAQIVGKTVETTMMGMLMAAVYLRTRSLWGAAFVHGITDWLVLLPATLVGGSISFVESGNTTQVFTYVFMAILLIPMVVRSVRELKKVDLNPVTPFDDEFVPMTPAAEPKLTKEEKKAMKLAAKQRKQEEKEQAKE